MRLHKSSQKSAQNANVSVLFSFLIPLGVIIFYITVSPVSAMPLQNGQEYGNAALSGRSNYSAQIEETITATTTPTLTLTETNTHVIDETLTPTETEIPTSSILPTEIPTPTPTPTPTSTITLTETQTPVSTDVETETPTPTFTETPTPTDCATEGCLTITPTEELIPPSINEALRANRSSAIQEAVPTIDPEDPNLPIQCEGVAFITELSGGTDFRAEIIKSLGDLNGDGKDDFAFNAGQTEEYYRTWYIFSGSGFNFLADITNNADPMFHPRSVTGLGNIYGNDNEQNGKNDDIGFHDIHDGVIWIYSQAGGDTWNIVKTLDVEPDPFTNSDIFVSIGDVNGDEKPDFLVGVKNVIYVFSGASPYDQLYARGLEGKPSRVVGLEDLNGDGNADFAISMYVSTETYPGVVSIRSGTNGEEISRIHGETGESLGQIGLVNIGKVEGENAQTLLIGVRKSTVYSVRQYSLRSNTEPEFIRQIDGGFSAEKAGDVNKDGKPDWLFQRRITPTTIEWAVMSFDGVELAHCSAKEGQTLGGASGLSDSDDNGYAEFAIGVPTAMKAYVMEYKPKPIELVSPIDWTIALSVHPTFTWKPEKGVDSYLLMIYPLDSQENPIESIPEDIITVRVACSPEADKCSFKPGIPQKNNTDPNNFLLSSGATIEEGGYAWKVYAINDDNIVFKESEYGYFQIPILGGTWEEVVAMGLCDPEVGMVSCINKDNNPTWDEYDDWIYVNAERWDIPPSIIKAIMIPQLSIILNTTPPL